MNGTTRCRKVAMLLCGLLITLPPLAMGTNTATVTVKVTVVTQPCTINGDRLIEVDFGDVVGPRVNGANYVMPVNYSLECTGNISNAMKMLIQGNPTVFDDAALQTNVTDFGIALRANGKPLRINDWLNFNYPNKPLLEAVAVKRAGATLAGGAFSAGATLVVAYQ
ncbi:fimbrial protein [Serratia liquefaciens]|uniref:fimbrial protein n=1 Tax=Serratia liquefaciens TaxID=614 RepID=UPI0023605D23|nr:fimbrial protein [Serratia liquefaciens]